MVPFSSPAFLNFGLNGEWVVTVLLQYKLPRAKLAEDIFMAIIGFHF